MFANICKCFDGSRSYLINHSSKEVWNAQLDFIIIAMWSYYFIISLIIWFSVSLDHVLQVFIIIVRINKCFQQKRIHFNFKPCNCYSGSEWDNNPTLQPILNIFLCMLKVDSTWAKDYYAEAISFWKFPTHLDKYSNRKQSAKGELMILPDAELRDSDAEYLPSEWKRISFLCGTEDAE